MGNVKYKKASESFVKMAAPDTHQSSGRKSIGMENTVGEFFYIKLENLIPFKNQAREIFDQEELDLLAESIRNYGIRQPLTVVKSPNEDGKFEIISGERRAKAAKIADLENVPCMILEDYKEAETIAIIENIHRSDLHPVELAKAYRSLLEKGVFSSADNLCNALGVNRSTGYEVLKVLQLPQEVQQFLLKKDIRNREKIRSLLKSKHPLEDIKDIDNKEKKQMAIMRIYSKGEEFVVQKRAIIKLSDAEKKKLKLLLEDLIKFL
jgi:ParB family chromosome partitioning protein